LTVRFSRKAEADLEAIADWIAAENYTAALVTVSELREQCLNLAELAERHPVYSRRKDEIIRRKVYKGYLIFDVSNKDVVEIARVIHGARDYSDFI
jgi:toxin ParE1/3/4